MKKPFQYIVIAVSGFLISSCTKNITGDNIDPKNPSSVPSGTLFSNAEKNLSDALNATADNIAPFRVLAQSWTENTYVSEARYVLSSADAPSGWWNALYSAADNTAPAVPSAVSASGVLNNLVAARLQAYKDVTDTAALRYDLNMENILEVYAYSLLVNTYGNIPYSQAFQTALPFPKYDDAKTVYYDLLHRLDTTIASLSYGNGAASWGNADLYYGGNVAAWKKFAATLELRLAMVIADADAATAEQYVQKAVNAGVFTSNNDNALFQYQASPSVNTNPVYQAYIINNRHDYSPADLMVDSMVNWNDPRLPLYYTQYNGAYAGGIPGAGNGYVTLSQFSSQWMSPSFAGDILDCAEADFLLAEAAARGFAVNGTPEQYYNNGVTASIEYWGGSVADAQTYLAQPAVNYDLLSAAGQSWKQIIGYQEWIAYANRGWDAWTVIRRLGYPNIDAVNPPVGAVSILPRRFYYPGNEQTSNAANWAQAVQAMGMTSDVVTARLWWEKY